MLNTHKLELPLSRTYFHGSKGVRAIEVLLSILLKRSFVLPIPTDIILSPLIPGAGDITKNVFWLCFTLSRQKSILTGYWYWLITNSVWNCCNLSVHSSTAYIYQDRVFNDGSSKVMIPIYKIINVWKWTRLPLHRLTVLKKGKIRLPCLSTS